MAQNSKIEWTEATWNPIVGCTIVSPGCTNCYAMKMAARLDAMGQPRYAGLTKPSKAGAVWTGEMKLAEEALTIPLRRKKPTVWFVNSMSDLFHESVPDAWIDRVFAVMALCPQHTFQVLTKRSARTRAYMADEGAVGERLYLAARAILSRCPGSSPAWPLKNVWLGVSAEDQRRADERVPDLLATPAAVRFVSAEPLLGPIDFTRIEARSTGTLINGDFAHPKRINALTGWAGHYPSPTVFHTRSHRVAALSWIIVGGESGPSARPMHPAWARSIRDQCAAVGVAYLFKQWGAWGPEHPDWPRAQATVMADDGTLYRPEDLACPDGARRGEAVRTNHDRATLTNIYRVGKKAAGRLLDGVEHNGMPEVRS
jgi:protein gp37